MLCLSCCQIQILSEIILVRNLKKACLNHLHSRLNCLEISLLYLICNDYQNNPYCEIKLSNTNKTYIVLTFQLGHYTQLSILYRNLNFKANEIYTEIYFRGSSTRCGFCCSCFIKKQGRQSSNCLYLYYKMFIKVSLNLVCW